MRDIDRLRCGYERFCGMFLFIQGENNDTKHIKNKKKDFVKNDNMNYKFIYLLKSFWFMFLITIPTINRSGTIRFKRNLSLFSTFCTGYFVHFSRTSIKSSSSIISIHISYFPLLFFTINVDVIYKNILKEKLF